VSADWQLPACWQRGLPQVSITNKLTAIDAPRTRHEKGQSHAGYEGQRRGRSGSSSRAGAAQGDQRCRRKNLAKADLQAVQQKQAKAAARSAHRTRPRKIQTAVRQTIADARAAVQKVSEAVAAKRTAESAQSARK
jgi:hypothetical protein